MASLFGSLFGRAEKKTEEPFQPVPPKTQQYDQEYIDYCIELEQTVSALEAYLHTSDDPKEIAMETLKTACHFYGGDWAGILDVDLDLDVWSPLWWYNLRSYDRTMMLFQSLFIKADEVSEVLGISCAEAYRIIKKLNGELAAKGYIVINGRVNRRYLEEQIYGFRTECPQGGK